MNEQIKEEVMRKILVSVLSVLALLIGGVTSAYAYDSYLTSPTVGFNVKYPGAGALSACKLCHINPGGGGPRNPYGIDWVSHARDFGAIEQLDSDGDTYKNIDEINAGTWPGDSTSHPNATPPPVACTDYSYSNWSACANGQQTRTASPIPTGCSGTPPVTQQPLTQACNTTPPPVACTDYSYSNWSACANGQQTRTASPIPTGCSGTPPVTKQPLTQVCNTNPPPTSGIPLPTGKKVFTYNAVPTPVLSSDPAAAKPIGVGSVANGGNTVDISVNIGPFASPVDISLALYAVGVDSGEVYLLNQWNSFESVHYAVAARSRRNGASEDEGDGENSSDKNENLTLWKMNVTGVNQHVYGPSPVTNLPSGPYILVLGAVPAGPGDKDESPSYHWVTFFFVP
jgi:hypothetical protein